MGKRLEYTLDKLVYKKTGAIKNRIGIGTFETEKCCKLNVI